MSSNTENLKLYKADPVVDKDKTFNIDKMLNENWDKIDEDSKGKVTKKEFNKDIKTPIYQESIVKSEVTNIVTDVYKQVKVNVKGKTVVNLLGNDGDCEDVSTWIGYCVDKIIDKNDKLFGSSSIKLTITDIKNKNSGDLYKRFYTNDIFDKTKYYCLSSFVKNGNSEGLSVSFWGDDGSTSFIAGDFVTDTKFKRVFIKIKPSDFGNLKTSIGVRIKGKIGQYGWVDGIMLNEITQEQYNDQDYQPPGYVNGDMSVGETITRIKTRSENLTKLNTPEVFGKDSISQRLSGLVSIIKEGDYFKILDNDSSDGYHFIQDSIKVKPNTRYVVSFTGKKGTRPLWFYAHQSYGLNNHNKLFDISTQITDETNIVYAITTLPDTNIIHLGFMVGDTTTNMTGYAYYKNVMFMEDTRKDNLASITSDFSNKKSGSFVENPNYTKHNHGGSQATSLMKPKEFIYESDQQSYIDMTTNDGIIGRGLVTVSANNCIPQRMFSFNIIEIIERKYGKIPRSSLSDKIKWCKDNVIKITGNWWGYVTNPSGNIAYFKPWFNVGSTWADSSGTNTPTTTLKTSIISKSYPTVSPANCIDVDGFVHFIAYTDASDGVKPSTVYTDYINVEVTANVNDITDPIIYSPYAETYLTLPHLRSLPDGVKDEIKDNKLIKRIEKVILDGSLNWRYDNTYTGYKRFATPINNILVNNYNCFILKYNNKVIPKANPWNSYDQQLDYNGNIYITVSSIDSGWGDSYTPTSEEIKAYFNGWKMYDSNTYTPASALGTNGATWSGTGTKYWVSLIDSNNYTNVCPVLLATGITPYRLYYQLATPIVEEINSNLVAFMNGDLILESESSTWVKPYLIEYILADNLKANLDEVMIGSVSNTQMISNLKNDFNKSIENINKNINEPINISRIYGSINADTLNGLRKENMLYNLVYLDQINGDDNFDGTSSKPVKTLQRAIDLIPFGGCGDVKLLNDYTMAINEVVRVVHKHLNIMGDKSKKIIVPTTPGTASNSIVLGSKIQLLRISSLNLLGINLVFLGSNLAQGSLNSWDYNYNRVFIQCGSDWDSAIFSITLVNCIITPVNNVVLIGCASGANLVPSHGVLYFADNSTTYGSASGFYKINGITRISTTTSTL